LVTWNEPDRRPVAVVVTTDGRRVNVPVENEVPLLSLIRSILVGIESLVLLITGGRDHGGKRRSDRS
jgi:Mg-chelatase subunit ChlD